MYKILVNCETRQFKIVNETYTQPVEGYDSELLSGYSQEVSQGICAVIIYFTVDRMRRGRIFFPEDFFHFCRDIIELVINANDVLEDSVTYITNENGD